MPKAITDEQREQWSSLHKRALALAEFFDGKWNGLGSGQSLQMAGAIRAAAEPAHPFAAHFAGLREALADLLVMASHLSAGDLRELDTHVRARLGAGLDELQTERLARIATIRAKGKLSSDEHYRLLKGRQDEIGDDPMRSEEAAALAKLLDAYEMRKRRR